MKYKVQDFMFSQLFNKYEVQSTGLDVFITVQSRLITNYKFGCFLQLFNQDEVKRTEWKFLQMFNQDKVKCIIWIFWLLYKVQVWMILQLFNQDEVQSPIFYVLTTVQSK